MTNHPLPPLTGILGNVEQFTSEQSVAEIKNIVIIWQIINVTEWGTGVRLSTFGFVDSMIQLLDVRDTHETLDGDGRGCQTVDNRGWDLILNLLQYITSERVKIPWDQLAGCVKLRKLHNLLTVWM